MPWVSEFDGTRFETRGEAFDAILENMTPVELADYFRNYVSYFRLFEWAMKQPNFFNDFDDDFGDAEWAYFEEFCHEIEDEDEDE